MSTSLLVENEAAEIQKNEVVPVVHFAQSLTIKSQEDSVSAQSFLKEIKAKTKAANDRIEPSVKAAHSAWKKIKDLQNSIIEPLERAEKLIKQKVVAWESEQERKRQDEIRKAQALADEKARKEREKLEEKARIAAEQGKVEKAEALLEKSQEVVAAPVFTPPTMPKQEGMSFRSNWKAEVTDKLALMKYAVETGNLPFFEVNQSVVNNLAKATKGSMAIPGIKFVEEKVMSVRA